jgi:sigma-B regulation protein RsbU (phosphoserine phosphatase)
MGEVTNWVLFLHTEPDGFDQSSIESRFLQANLLGNLTNTKRISKELREANAWIEREIDEIAGIQRGLLPQGPPCAPGIDAAAYYATFDRAGGDYYDIIRTGPNNGASVFIVADASGHGPSAAVVVAIASTLLHARPEHLGGPAELLTYLNRHLVRRRINQSFVTALVCMVDDERKRLTMSSAGHPMAVLCRDGSARELPQAGGIPLGISLKADYVEAEYELREGDTLLMYTDGVTEARAPSGQQFGEERLLSALACSGSPGECIENILKVLREHEAGRRPTDDQTMLVLKMTQGGQSAADVD